MISMKWNRLSILLIVADVILVQLTRRRQLKAQTVQRQLEEVAVRQMQLEEQSANIGFFLLILQMNSNFKPFFRETNPK